MQRPSRSLDLRSTLIGALGCTVLFVTLGADRLGARGTSVTTISMLTREQAEILSHMSIVHLDDEQGGTRKTVRFESVNVQVVNGTGTTDGPVNGLGNLIVGYNETGNYFGDDRTGSHNIVAGSESSHSSYGCVIQGLANTVAAPYSATLGGRKNRCFAEQAVVCGGDHNRVTGSAAAVLGGQSNLASGRRGTVSGGVGNTASFDESTVSGGASNLASGPFAAVSGGAYNTASGHSSAVSGGSFNQAMAQHSAVSGGMSRTAPGSNDWVAGSQFEDD